MSATTITDSDKKNLYSFLAQDYIKALKESTIRREDRPVISKQIVEFIPTMQTWEEIDTFLAKLETAYPFCQKAHIQYKGEMYNYKEKQVMKDLQSYIQNL